MHAMTLSYSLEYMRGPSTDFEQDRPEPSPATVVNMGLLVDYLRKHGPIPKHRIKRALGVSRMDYNESEYLLMATGRYYLLYESDDGVIGLMEDDR